MIMCEVSEGGGGKEQKGMDCAWMVRRHLWELESNWQEYQCCGLGLWPSTQHDSTYPGHSFTVCLRREKRRASSAMPKTMKTVIARNAYCIWVSVANVPGATVSFRDMILRSMTRCGRHNLKHLEMNRWGSSLVFMGRGL